METVGGHVVSPAVMTKDQLFQSQLEFVWQRHLFFSIQ
jgi:hypothetical protein